MMHRLKTTYAFSAGASAAAELELAITARMKRLQGKRFIDSAVQRHNRRFACNRTSTAADRHNSYQPSRRRRRCALHKTIYTEPVITATMQRQNCVALVAEKQNSRRLLMGLLRAAVRTDCGTPPRSPQQPRAHPFDEVKGFLLCWIHDDERMSLNIITVVTRLDGSSSGK